MRSSTGDGKAVIFEGTIRMKTLAKSAAQPLGRRSKFLFAVLLFQVLTFSGFNSQARIEAVIGSENLQKNENLPGFIPSVNSDEIIISRPQYIISYNRERRSPNWVAWKVDIAQLGSVQRSNHFQLDTDLENYLDSVDLRNPVKKSAVAPTEYKRSCFDRGHQSPSGDRTADADDNEATFMMTNMIPQTAYLNRVIWEHLEEHTRDLVREENKTIYVIAGPIYDKNYGSIGPNKDIPVPSKNFKMLLILDRDVPYSQILKSAAVESVIMPNVLADGSDPTDENLLCSQTIDINAFSKDDWQKYRVPVSSIEATAHVVLH